MLEFCVRTGMFVIMKYTAMRSLHAQIHKQYHRNTKRQVILT